MLSENQRAAFLISMPPPDLQHALIQQADKFEDHKSTRHRVATIGSRSRTLMLWSATRYCTDILHPDTTLDIDDEQATVRNCSKPVSELPHRKHVCLFCRISLSCTLCSHSQAFKDSLLPHVCSQPTQVPHANQTKGENTLDSLFQYVNNPSHLNKWEKF